MFVVAIVKDGFAVNCNSICLASVSSTSPKYTITVLHHWDVSNTCQTKMTFTFFVHHIYFQCDGDTLQYKYYCH